MKFPNEKELEKIRKEYPIGTMVQLISMRDAQAPPAGTIGEVAFVDDAGSIHTRWENGGGLAFIPDVDEVRKL